MHGMRMEKGKREAGVNPARSRHCDKGVRCLGAQRRSLEALPLGRRQRAVSFQSGNLPAVGTGASAPDHEELVVPKSPETTEVFLSCHPQDRRASFFISLSFPFSLLFCYDFQSVTCFFSHVVHASIPSPVFALTGKISALGFL